MDLDLPNKVKYGQEAVRNKELFSLLVAAVKDYAIFMLDTQGRVITWNAGAQRIKGYTAEEIIGKHFSTFYTEDDLKDNKPENELAAAIENGRLEDSGWRLRKDGTRFWANVVITPVYDSADRLCGFAKVTRDLTEQKRQQDELLTARDEAIQANKAKSLFVANISHEIRTPMAGIIGMAEMLVNSEHVQGEDKQAAEHVFASSLKLLAVLNDLLDFSQLESGKLVLEKHAFSLRKLLQEVVHSITLPAQKKQLSVVSSAADNLPDSVIGDEGKIQQTLLNLAHNAVKFSEIGVIEIAIRPVHLSDNEITVEFVVKDTGIGISEEVQKCLFQPFTQADVSIRRRYGGTGLGLSIAKRFVEMMDGQIGIESQEGKGSTFWFVLPFAIADADQ